MTETGNAADGWSRRQREQAAGFDAIGANYDEVFPHKDGQLHAGELLLARLPGGARVLDVGCGTGLPTAGALAAAGCTVTGIDISPTMVELARHNVPGATLRQCDVVDLDAQPGSFDAVTAFFSLLMLPRERIVATLGRLRELLVPGGWLVTGMVEADLDDVALPFLGTSLRLTGWPRTELERVITAAGFIIEASDARSYAPPPPAPPETQLFHLSRRDDTD